MSRSTSLILVLHLAVSLPLLFWLVPAHGADGAAMALLAASVVTAPANFALLGKAITFSFRDLVTLLWRPALGTLATSAVLLAVRSRVQRPAAPLAQIGHAALLVGAGALVYATVVAVLWSVRRDPGAPEAQLVEKIRAWLGRRRARGPAPRR